MLLDGVFFEAWLGFRGFWIGTCAFEGLYFCIFGLIRSGVVLFVLFCLYFCCVQGLCDFPLCDYIMGFVLIELNYYFSFFGIYYLGNSY